MKKIAWGIIFFLSFSLATENISIKENTISGKYYPADVSELTQLINSFLRKAVKNEQPGQPWALVVPHAAYEFSGQTAAYAYKLLENKNYDTVVLIAPAHTDSFKGLAVYPEGEFSTPLGKVQINAEWTKKLLDSGAAKDYSKAFAGEHALEVELPFLQTMLKNFKLVPIICGQSNLREIQKLTQELLELSGKEKTLIIASTDLSHYKPYKENDAMDMITLGYIEQNDVLGLYQAGFRQEIELCGFWPVLAVMLMAEQKKSLPVILEHNNSGYATGDYSSVVGYAAVAYYEKNKEVTMNNEFNLTETEKKALLKLARESIAAKLKRKNMPSTDLGFEKAQRMGAAFVTLHKNGQLRGCIGHVRAIKPLAETVRSMALAAAFEDPRFYPMKESELKDIDIEISVLSPMEPVSNVEDIVIGKHGLFIVEGFNSGLLLPQVATEENWTREQFLEGVCRKAGLPVDAWQKGAMLYAFSAEIFSEK